MLPSLSSRRSLWLLRMHRADTLLDRGDQELSFEVLVAIIGALEAEIWLLEVGPCNGVGLSLHPHAVIVLLASSW